MSSPKRIIIPIVFATSRNLSPGFLPVITSTSLSEMKGNATDIEIHAMQLEKVKAKINAIIAEATGTALETVAADTDRDHWLDAEQALSYGLISRIVRSGNEI